MLGADRATVARRLLDAEGVRVEVVQQALANVDVSSPRFAEKHVLELYRFSLAVRLVHLAPRMLRVGNAHSEYHDIKKYFAVNWGNSARMLSGGGAPRPGRGNSMGRVRYLNIAVSCYSGYQYSEKPLAFAMAGSRHRIRRVVRQWRSPHGQTWFDVETEEGQRFLLAYDARRDVWIGEAKSDLVADGQGSDDPATEA